MSSKIIRMLHVCRHEYPSFRVDLTKLFSKEFVDSGHSIDWMTQAMEEGMSTQTIIMNEHERMLIGKSFSNDSAINKALNKVLTVWHDLKLFTQARKQHYDIIQIRDKTFASLIALVARKFTKSKVVYWMSYTFVENDQLCAQQAWQDKQYPKAIYLWCRFKITGFYLYKIIIPLADHTFVQSDRMLSHVAARGNFDGKLTAVPMGVSDDDLELQLSPMEDERLQGKVPIVYVGTMIAIRRIDFFIHVLNEVLKSVPNAVLLLVGNDSPKDMAALRAEVERLNLQDHVVFTDFIQRLDAWRYVKACRVAMAALPPNPVLDTCSPTKAVEYMALEVPCVVNDIGDQGTIVQASEAGLVADYEVADFAKAVIRLIEDDELYSTMKKNGRPYVIKHRSYGYLGSMVQEKYHQIL